MLAFEKETDDYNHDDENGDSQTVCKSVVSYERDSARLQVVSARIRCEANGKFVPPIQTRRFRWEPARKRFEESQMAGKRVLAPK